MSIDTTNKFLVGVHGSNVVVMNPKLQMTKDEALVLAAYLVTLSMATDEEWQATLKAVQNT